MAEQPGSSPQRPERKPVLLRLDPVVHEALARWAADDLRSLNAHIEVLLRDSLKRAGRTPKNAGPLPKRGRPSAS
ncbi:MAG: toxin-antitoxin system HicB family antitoxin [Propionibacteriaceae bacterium]|nr:toxin-antitoxin system HicB family antitoxin [Propionibacteriaceae bacterium]